jgi:hypothetical protein
MDNWTRVFIVTIVLGGVMWVVGLHVFGAFLGGASAGASLFRFLEEL